MVDFCFEYHSLISFDDFIQGADVSWVQISNRTLYAGSSCCLLKGLTKKHRIQEGREKTHLALAVHHTAKVAPG